MCFALTFNVNLLQYQFYNHLFGLCSGFRYRYRRGRLGLDSRTGQIRRFRHRCDVSVLPRRCAAEMDPPLVTRFSVMPRVKRFCFMRLPLYFPDGPANEIFLDIFAVTLMFPYFTSRLKRFVLIMTNLYLK